MIAIFRFGSKAAIRDFKALPHDRLAVAGRPRLRLGAEDLLRPGGIVVGHAGNVVDPLALRFWLP